MTAKKTQFQKEFELVEAAAQAGRITWTSAMARAAMLGLAYASAERVDREKRQRALIGLETPPEL